MGAFAAALTELAGLTVTGVRHNFAIEDVPDDLSRAQLPALLTLPVLQENRLFAERGAGFETLAFSAGPRTVTYAVTHLLLVAPVPAGQGIRASLPLLVDLIDAYFAALSATVTLNGALLDPPRVRVEPGKFRHGTTEYYGCAFRHLWTVRADGG